MQNACKNNDSTMAAILALSDEIVDEECKKINRNLKHKKWILPFNDEIKGH